MAVFEQKTVSKVTLDDTVPLTCTIETAHSLKDHTEYIIRVQRGPVPGHSWTVSRRYSEFAWLDNELRISGLELPLPPKKIIGKMEREFIAERQQGLQVFTNAILNNHLLAHCIAVKIFLDPEMYTFNLQDTALQHISMFFRSEPRWEVIEPAPDIGWRLRKKYFMIKDRNQPKEKFILSWCNFGPDKFLPDKELELMMKLLPTFQHPYIHPILFATSNETSGIAIRAFHEGGTLRDIICKAKPRLHHLKKYGKPKVTSVCQMHVVRIFGRQVLETLKYLHDKGLPYGHLHAGNIVVVDNRCRLLDLENSLLGLPSVYRCYYTQFKKIQTLESVDVYAFGHLLYEMTFGEQLNAASCDCFPQHCPPELRSMLECILSTEACKNGLPTLADLLTHPLFCDVILPPSANKPQVKVPSKVKDTMREALHTVEKRLHEEQKTIHKYKRLSKAQAFHMSDEEKKKRRKSKRKQLSEQNDSVEQHQQQQVNGDLGHGDRDKSSVSIPPTSNTPQPMSPPPPPEWAS